jgi:hypothetical protein
MKETTQPNDEELAAKGRAPMSCSAACYDCGKPYVEIGDCVIADDMWEQINPSPHKGGGILCPNCILARLHKLGISGVSATL